MSTKKFIALTSVMVYFFIVWAVSMFGRRSGFDFDLGSVFCISAIPAVIIVLLFIILCWLEEIDNKLNKEKNA